VTLAELIDMLLLQLASELSHPRGIAALAAGTVAAILIVVSAFVKTIIPLRWLAVGGNIGFMVYGAVHPSWMVFALHVTLLPVNLFRAVEMVRLTRRVRRSAASGDQSGVWLRPYMRQRKHRAGSILFRKGDLADHLYLLADGQIEFVEAGIMIEPGRIFGEIAFFAPDRRRTGTARCVTPCTVLRIDETTFKQLYFQNPDFGFEVVRLIASRLTEDITRLQGQIGAPDLGPPPREDSRPPAATS